MAAIEDPIKFITDADRLPPLEELPSVSCVIFDDCIMLEEKTTIDLFLCNQHSRIDVLTIANNYIDLPRLIRKKCFSLWEMVTQLSPSTGKGTMTSCSLSFAPLSVKKFDDLRASL